MKKLIVIMLLGLCAGSIKAGETALYQKGSFEVLAPLVNTSAVYMYDFVGARNLIGAETSVVKWGNFYGVVGLAGDVSQSDGGDAVKQIPFLGIHTPAMLSFLENTVTVGAFAGRDFNHGDTVAGVKCSAKIW